MTCENLSVALRFIKLNITLVFLKCVLFTAHSTGQRNVSSSATTGNHSSPVRSPCWSSLYWGVEYKSRHTGPFSVATKSKDVPFGVGTAWRPPQWITNNMRKWGMKNCTAICPTKANRKLPLTHEMTEHRQIVLLKQIGLPVGAVTMAAPLESLLLCRAARGVSLFTLHMIGWTWQLLLSYLFFILTILNYTFFF